MYVTDILEDAEVLERGRIPVDWEEDGDAALLGNDFVFCTAFVTAFLFNWVGFLLLMCFCHTIAARFASQSLDWGQKTFFIIFKVLIYCS